MTVAAPAATLSFKEALSVIKGERRGADRERANQKVVESVKSSVEHVALRWHNLGVLRRWLDLDDLCQELRCVLLTRCVKGFHVPQDKPDEEVARIFGRYAIVVFENYLKDTSRHAGRNWTMHLGSIDRIATSHGSGGLAGRDSNAAEVAADERTYVNEARALDEREMFGAVRAALTEEQAQIAYLLYEGKSWKEVGALLGENPGTLRDRMRRRAAPVLKALLTRWRS